MDVTNDLLKALVTATDQQKAAALRLLQGQPVETAGPTRPEPYLTLRSVGKQLGISACTLWRWDVPGHELGGRRRFRMSEVEAYLKSDAFGKRSADLRQDRKERRTRS